MIMPRAVCPFATPIQNIHYSYEKDLLADNLLSARQRVDLQNPTQDIIKIH